MQNESSRVAGGRGKAEEAGGARRGGSRLRGDFWGEAGTWGRKLGKGKPDEGRVELWMGKGKVKLKPQRGKSNVPWTASLPPRGRSPSHPAPPPLARLEAPQSREHLFRGQSWSPSHSTTALQVHLALEIGSRDLDRHQVSSSAPPTLSRPLQRRRPPSARWARGSDALKSGRVVAGRYRGERGVCAEQ